VDLQLTHPAPPCIQSPEGYIMRDTGFRLGVKVTLIAAALVMVAGGAWAADKSASASSAGSSSDKSKSKSMDQGTPASGDHGSNKAGDHGKNVAMAGSPGTPATPPSELDANFKSFEGTWKCDARIPAGATGPNSPENTTKATVKIKKDLNGFWYVGEYDAKKGKTTPEMKGQFFLGYNPNTKQATMTNFDSTGGMVQSTGTGLQGDTLTFTGEGTHGGQKVKVRETMTKKSDKEVTHRVEVDSGQGYQQVIEETCKK
jgi:hypothetical protein